MKNGFGVIGLIVVFVGIFAIGGVFYVTGIIGGTDDEGVEKSNETSELNDENPTINNVEKSIAILSPSGGEIWGADKTYTIIWSTSGFKDNSEVEVILEPEGGSEAPLIIGRSNSNEIQWRVTKDSIPLYLQPSARAETLDETCERDGDIKSGKYKIWAAVIENGIYSQTDTSSPFTINVPCTCEYGKDVEGVCNTINFIGE